jgi:uncharacterized protein (TIGR01777 family)
MFAVMKAKLTFEEIEELISRVHVGLGRSLARDGNELGEVGVHVAVGDHVAEALKEISGLVDAGLRHADPLLAAMNAEEGSGLGLEEIGEVFGKDHGDAGQVAQGGHDAASLKLGKKAGREARVLSELDQAHGFLEAEPFDALTDMLFLNEALSGLGIDLSFLGFFSLHQCRLGHGAPPEVDIGCSAEGEVAKIKNFSCQAKFGSYGNRYRIHEGEKTIDLTNRDVSTKDGPAARVLCSGGSGMVGTALRGALIRGGAEVVQLVRRAPQGLGEIQWDPRKRLMVWANERGAEGPLEGLEAAVHLGGLNLAARRWTPAYKLEIETSRVQSTRVLAKILAGLKRPPKSLLVASATGFYGDRDDEFLDEESSAGRGFLPEICAKWEAASEPASAAGIRVVHLRLGVVLGRDGALKKMLPIFRLGLGGQLGSGQQWMSWISLEDAVRAILFAMKSETLRGPVNVVAPNPVTNAEFTRALGRALHRPAVMPVPAPALKLMFGEMADEALLASTRAVPGKLMGAGFRFEQGTIEEALAAVVGSRQ